MRKMAFFVSIFILFVYGTARGQIQVKNTKNVLIISEDFRNLLTKFLEGAKTVAAHQAQLYGLSKEDAEDFSLSWLRNREATLIKKFESSEIKLGTLDMAKLILKLKDLNIIGNCDLDFSLKDFKQSSTCKKETKKAFAFLTKDISHDLAIFVEKTLRDQVKAQNISEEQIASEAIRNFEAYREQFDREVFDKLSQDFRLKLERIPGMGSCNDFSIKERRQIRYICEVRNRDSYTKYFSGNELPADYSRQEF